MSVKRVLVFSTDDHLYPAGGAEQAFGNISERLPDIEFDLICARLRKNAVKYEQIKNVRIHRIGFGIPKLDGLVLALYGHRLASKLYKERNHELVWSIMASYGAFAVVKFKKKNNIPFLLTLQEGDSFEYIYGKVKFVRRQFDEIFATANAVQAISNYLMQWAKDMGFNGVISEVIPNGVSIESFTKEYSPESIEAKRVSFGFAADSRILITSSRLEVKNGVSDVIEALPLLPNNVCFVICGSGSLEDELKSRVTELNLNDRVAFEGFVDPRELPLYMNASDIFIRPSLTEGLGNAFLEAMVVGLITIGTNAGGIPDFLKDGHNGFMVSIKDPENIAKVVSSILNLSEQELLAIKKAAYDTVVGTYDWDIIAEQMREIMNKTCTHSS